MPLSFQVANNQGILINQTQNAWHAGHVQDLLPLPNNEVLAGAHTGGLWRLSLAGEGSALVDWDNPDITCLAQGPDSREHFFAAAGNLLYENLSTNLQGWTQLNAPGTRINSLSVLVGLRRIVAGCDNGIFWAEIPAPGQPRTYIWRMAPGIATRIHNVESRSYGSSWAGFNLTSTILAKQGRQTTSLVCRSPVHRDLFWIGTDHSINTAWSHITGGGYAPWHSHPINGPNAAHSISSIASIARNSNHIDVFWIGSDGAIWSTWWDQSRTEGWTNHTFALTSPNRASPFGGLAAVARSPTHLDIFWIGIDGAVWTSWWDAGPGGNWTGHEAAITNPGVAAPNSPVTAISRNSDHLDVFWVGTDGSVATTWWNARRTEGWTGHTYSVTGQGQAVSTGGISVVSRNPKHLDLFWIGNDGSIRTSWWYEFDSAGWLGHAYQATNSGWAGSASAVIGLSRNPIHLDVFSLDTNGQVKSTWWDAYNGTGLRGNVADVGSANQLFPSGLSAAAMHEDGLTISCISVQGEVWINTLKTTNSDVLASGYSGEIWKGNWQTDSPRPDRLVLTSATIGGGNGSTMARTSIAASKFTSGTFAVSANSDGSMWGFLQSNDFGATWSVISNTIPTETGPNATLEGQAGGQGNRWNNALAASPVDPGTVVVGWQNGPFLSRDAGLTWYNLNRRWTVPHLHSDIHKLRFDPYDKQGKTILVGSDGGVAVTIDYGLTFFSAYNNHLANLQCYTTDARRGADGTLGVTSEVDYLLAIGLQDNGTTWCLARPSGATPWQPLNGSDGGLTSFTKDRQLIRKTSLQITPQPIYRVEWDNNQQQINHDTNEIIPITRLRPGGSNGESGLLDAFAAVVNRPASLDVWGGRVYAIGWKGSDVYGFCNPILFSGWRWEYIATVSLQTGEYLNAGGSADSNTIFLGTSNGRIFRMDRHTGRSELLTVIDPIRNFGINRLCVVSDTVAYALYNDWRGGVNQGRILRLSGSEWRRVPGRLTSGGTLPDEVYFSIDADLNAMPATLFACTDNLVYVSRDNGESWTIENNGLPRRAHLADIRVVRESTGQRKVYLSTYGRSVWVSPVT